MAPDHQVVTVADTCLLYYTACLMGSNLKNILVSGTSILSQEDDTTPEGLQKTFATNVFGHYLMVENVCGCVRVCVHACMHVCVYE